MFKPTWVFGLLLVTSGLGVFTAKEYQRSQSQGGATGKAVCLDEDGHPVDWFIAYKFPGLPEEKSPFNTGYAYAYITSDKVRGFNGRSQSVTGAIGNHKTHQVASGETDKLKTKHQIGSATSVEHRETPTTPRKPHGNQDSDPDWKPSNEDRGRSRHRKPNRANDSRPVSLDSAEKQRNTRLETPENHPLRSSSVARGESTTERRTLIDRASDFVVSLVSNNSSRLPRSSSRDPADNSYWTISSRLISDKQSLIMQTLAIAYKNPSTNLNSIFYNDQPPKVDDEETSSSQSRAHAKGVLLIDDITGKSIWLTHSTPKFPPQRDQKLEFQDNAKYNGQTFMCISFDARQSGSQVVDHLITMFPQVYDSQISDRLYSMIPNLKELKVTNDKSRRKDKNSNKLSQKINTLKGESLHLFSKSADFGHDMYSDWIENELKSNLYVATWRKGGGTPLNSSCPRNSFHVNNVQDFKVDENQHRVTWSHLQDHSKWAISEESEHGFVCISDINRMESQFKRGGGAVCFRCPGCWSVFSKTILDIESCPVQSKLNAPYRKSSSSSDNSHVMNTTSPSSTGLHKRSKNSPR